MWNLELSNQQKWLEAHSQIESIIHNYLLWGGEKDIKVVLKNIENIIPTHWVSNIEVVVRSIIELNLQKSDSSIKINLLTDQVSQLTNEIVVLEKQLDAIYSRKWVLTVTSDGTIEDVNEPMLAVSGYSRDDLIGQNMSIMSSWVHTEEFWRDFYKTINAGEVWEWIIINTKKDWMNIYYQTLVIPFPWTNKSWKKLFKVLRRDVSEEKKSENILEAYQNNRIDPFTKLPTNRQMYIDYTKKLPKMLSVVHLNDLKDINMAYWETIGSKVLQKVAILLNKYARAHPWLGIHIYKLSWPEFAITYDVHLHQDFFDGLYKKMSTVHLRNFWVVLDSGVDLTIQPSFSFWVALEGSDINLFLTNALSALTLSKGHSSELIIYEKRHNTQTIAIEEIEMKRNIRNAFADDGFVLDFQPVVEVVSFRHIRKLFKSLFYKKDKDYLSYEVLVRMINPQDPSKRISPWAFLPIIEADNQNVQLTTRVIELASSFMVVNSGHYSINITAADFNMVGRAKMIHEQVEKYGLNLSRFTFEVLENIKTFTPVALDNIKYFVKKWARISIDDYGYWFSSLEKLRISDAHFLKLDMSLIRWIDMNRANMAYVRFAIETAHKMKAEVIAEGVETEAEREVLKWLWVDRIQWYVFGRPESTIKQIPEYAMESLLFRSVRSFIRLLRNFFSVN